MTRPAPIKDPRAAFIKQSVSDRDRARLCLDEPKRTFDLEAAERILASLISIAPRGVVQEALPALWETIVSRLGKGEVPTTHADLESLLHLGLGTHVKCRRRLEAADRALITIPRVEQDRIKRIKKEAEEAGLDLENKRDFEEVLRALDPADRQNLWPVFTEFDEGVRTREEIDEATWSAAGESWVSPAPGMEAIKKKRHRVFLQRLAEVGGGEFNEGLRNEAAVSLGYTTKSGQNWVREIKVELDRAARGQA